MKKIAILCAVTLLSFFMLGFLPVHGEEKIYDSVIRLHVLANSDSEEDQSLKLKVRDTVAALTEELTRAAADIDDAERILRESLELIRSRAPRVLAIDMSAVDFMDSSGLGLIMGRLSLMQSIGGETQILDPSPATERIMGLAGMERMLKIKRTKISASDMPELRKRTASARGGTRRRSGVRGVCSTCGAVAVGTRDGDIGGEAK